MMLLLHGVSCVLKGYLLAVLFLCVLTNVYTVKMN